MAEIALDISIAVTGQNRNIEIGMTRNPRSISFEIAKGGMAIPEYEGPYTVIPVLHDAQELETKGKRMADDMTVEAIPVVITSNPYGGRTVVIG